MTSTGSTSCSTSWTTGDAASARLATVLRTSGASRQLGRAGAPRRDVDEARAACLATTPVTCSALVRGERARGYVLWGAARVGESHLAYRRALDLPAAAPAAPRSAPGGRRSACALVRRVRRPHSGRHATTLRRPRGRGRGRRAAPRNVAPRVSRTRSAATPRGELDDGRSAGGERHEARAARSRPAPATAMRRRGTSSIASSPGSRATPLRSRPGPAVGRRDEERRRARLPREHARRPGRWPSADLGDAREGARRPCERGRAISPIRTTSPTRSARSGRGVRAARSTGRRRARATTLLVRATRARGGDRHGQARRRTSAARRGCVLPRRSGDVDGRAAGSSRARRPRTQARPRPLGRPLSPRPRCLGSSDRD